MHFYLVQYAKNFLPFDRFFTAFIQSRICSKKLLENRQFTVIYFEFSKQFIILRKL